VVLGLSCADTEQVLQEAGYRGLYAADLFELCIWFVLNTGRDLQGLYHLHSQALEQVDQAVSSASAPAWQPDAPPSVSRMLTQTFAASRDLLCQSADGLTQASFFAFLTKFAPYLRHHQNGIQQSYLEARDRIVQALQRYFLENEDEDPISLPFSRRFSSLYDFFLPCLSWSPSSFSETTRQFGEMSHIKHPSREFLILTWIYEGVLTSFLSQEDGPAPVSLWQINRGLARLELPQLNGKLAFDRAIMEFLRFSEEDGETSQHEKLARLLPLYQFVQYCRQAQDAGALTEEEVKKLARIFDALLDPPQHSFSFVTTCRLVGHGKPYIGYPHRGVLLLLSLLRLWAEGAPVSSAALSHQLARFVNLAQVRTGALILPLLPTPFEAFLAETADRAPQDLPRLLAPFFRFLVSFRRLTAKSAPQLDWDALFAAFCPQMAESTMATEKAPRLDLNAYPAQLAALFDLAEAHASPPPTAKLLDCQMGIQTSFSCLEVQVQVPAGWRDLTLTVCGQEKYAPRQRTGGKGLWATRFPNLRYGSYDLRLTWQAGGRQGSLTVPAVALSGDSPSRTIHVDFGPGDTALLSAVVPAEGKRTAREPLRTLPLSF
jgi:hypothetical protein